MDTRPKLSLVIPAYNEEKYIGDCLEHALRNSGGLFSEIIVIDNASTDGTRAVAEKFPGVRVVREDTKGLTSARQRGYREARGDILAYIDADTRMPAGWAEQIVREFEKNRHLACLSGPYIYYDIPRLQRVFVWMYWHLLGLPIYWIIGYMVVGGNFAIRTETLDKMEGFDTTIAFYGEDTNIARRAHAFGKVKFSPRFAMHTSGRRFGKQGLAGTAFTYMLNFVSEALFHRQATGEYTDIR